MFSPPPKVLQRSLHKLLDYARDYVADVRFDYPSAQIWAHRAILLSRIPRSFRRRYLRELEADGQGITIVNNPVIPYRIFLHLLRFWYTAEFFRHDTYSRSCIARPVAESSLSEVSLTTSVSSASACTVSSEIECRDHTDIIFEIQALEKQLEADLLPANGARPWDVLVADLDRMRKEAVASDVVIYIFSGTKEPCYSFRAHRFMLAVQSSYFHAMFCREFREASSPNVHLPGDLFSPITLQVILGYFYTNVLSIPPAPESRDTSTRGQSIMRKMHALRIFRDVFKAADYLGHYDTICLAVLHEMAKICDNFKCNCQECAVLLPSMLLFSDDNKNYVPVLRQSLVALYADPLQSLPSLWSSSLFARLVEAKHDIVYEVVRRLQANIKKHTAINVLEALHLCLVRLESADPGREWSHPVRDILNQLVNHTVLMISNNFGFYCVEYPILVSYVDGIGVGSALSVDFLEFLLQRVLDEGIHNGNAGDLYQGIVRNLIGRQKMDEETAVDNVLNAARQLCINYLARHWSAVKAQDGFKNVDKDVMLKLAEDIDVPYRTLTKSFSNDFAFLFKFRPKVNRQSKKQQAESEYEATCNSTAGGSNLPRRRLSLRSLKKRLSAEGLGISFSGSKSADHTPGRSYLSVESKLPYSKTYPNVSVTEKSMNLQNCRSPQPSLSSSLLADALLPTDLKELGLQITPSTSLPPRNNTPATKKTTLTFELPEIPQRPASTTHIKPLTKANKSKKRSGLRSRFRISSSNHYYSSGSDLSDNESSHASPVVPVLGATVQVLHRPLPMRGVVKYLGPVHFDDGLYVGVELHDRLGIHDGMYKGTRYFQTDPQRGAFFRPDQLKVISFPSRT